MDEGNEISRTEPQQIREREIYRERERRLWAFSIDKQYGEYCGARLMRSEIVQSDFSTRGDGEDQSVSFHPIND